MKELYAVKGIKVNSETGDGHKDGTKCLIIAESVDSSMGMMYLAIFKGFGFPIGVVDYKIKLFSNDQRVKLKLTQMQSDYLEPFGNKMFKFYDTNPDEES